MSTRNISLPRDLEEYVSAKVSSGEYAHASEVVRDGLRLLMRQEAEKLEWLREAISKGVSDVKHGRVLSSGEAFRVARKRGMAMLKVRKAR
jgi:antitoxin ParD1/3/4